jgi:predicted amidophosphoribosyltransferase
MVECWCCRRVGALLDEAPGAGPRLVPVCLCRPGDALHGALRRYKDAPAVSARDHFARLLGALLDEFLRARWARLRDDIGSWDAVCPVPSSARGRVRPIDAVLSYVPALERTGVVELRLGSRRASHLSPAAEAFVAPADLAARRVLVLDDTWVTGARARSAAAALRRAGAEVAGIATIGRAVDPCAAPWVRRWWEAQMAAAPLAPTS